jgi:tetrahydromethanopterin S-methyltransferase subunit C
MLSQIFFGMASGYGTETILVQSTIALVVAAFPGWIIGQLADAVVRESIEIHYRRQIEQYKSHKGTQQGSN